MSAGGPSASPPASRPDPGVVTGGVGRLTVLYDGRCRVCTRAAGRLAGMDGQRRLRLVPVQRAAQERPELRLLAATRDLRAVLHVIDEDGQWASGGEAVLRTMEQVPRLRPLARLARLPGAASLVEPAYRLVARHRARFAWLAGDFRMAASAPARRRTRGRAGSARSRR